MITVRNCEDNNVSPQNNLGKKITIIKTNVYCALAICQALCASWFIQTVSYYKHTKPLRRAVLGFPFHKWRAWCLVRLRETCNSGRGRGEDLTLKFDLFLNWILTICLFCYLLGIYFKENNATAGKKNAAIMKF